MEFEGIVIRIGVEEIVGINNLRKITFVLEEDTTREFKGSIAIDLFGEKVDMLQNFKEGDKVKASLNLKAKEYNGRWYNSITAWKIDKLGEASGSNTSTTKSEKPADDDLPF